MSQPSTSISETKSPRRRTLQSGFSLMARGEPKIWLTGGMLVICLAMIAGLLTLIVASGLATFWPGPIDWLLLSDQQMDIGEPQRTELRLDSGATSDRSKANAPSRFYRTANFDLTNRHYRWFEPTELSAAGIVRPEWALLIERQSWGRMLALPSRLSRSLNSFDADHQKIIAASQLLQELSAELEPLAAEEPPVPLADLSAALNEKLNRSRSQQLKRAIEQALRENNGSVQWQSPDAATWIAAPEPLADDANVAAARVVNDDPVDILKHIEPVLSRLSQVRWETEQAMHRISLLDRDLSDARVDVRQAELNTGRAVLEKVDSVGPILEGLAASEHAADRVKDLLADVKSLSADPAQAQQWEQLLRRYLEKNLTPSRQALEQELTGWQQQFTDEPLAIRESIERFQQAWKSTLAKKKPLEASIQASESRTEGNELLVLLPTDAVKLELEPADSEALFAGQWTDRVIEQLAAQSIAPIAREQPEQTKPATNDADAKATANLEPPRVKKFGDNVAQIEFEDRDRGRLSLWGWKTTGDETTWLLPQQKPVNCSEIVRLFPPNQLSIGGKLAVYAARWREFLFDNPREANTEGGVFPAIWGTIVMTLIMTLAVVPFGVIAALYLREYTRSGPIVSLVRISINNLAGVPSIVYGVFGLAFFCYSMGAFIDGGAKNAQFGALPSNQWYLILSVTVAVGVGAFLLSILGSGANPSQGGWQQRLTKLAPALWFLSLVGAGVLIFKSPFFDGLYEARLPAPTFGKEGLLWASLTLALLTLPVVIVATEEALSAVPNSLREGSLACGASKWQTIYRIVLPHARPGILTGAILAMARGIGEVAPLMLVGALPVAPDLPLDGEFPYFHGSRSFMHLGYQIYWLGFQSQNSEASKPLVFTCTLLLILIVISLNLAAIMLRARLRRRFQGNQF